MALFAPKLLNEIYEWQSAVNTHYSTANNCDFALPTLLYNVIVNELYIRICGKERTHACNLGLKITFHEIG